MYFLNLKFKIYGVIWKKNLELLLNDLNHCTLRVYVCVACVDGFDPTAPRLGPLSLPHIIEGFAVRRTVIPVCFCLSLEIPYRRQPAAVPHRRRRRRTTQPISRPHIEVSIHQWHRPPYFARCIELLQSGDPSIHDPPSRPWIDLSFSW